MERHTKEIPPEHFPSAHVNEINRLSRYVWYPAQDTPQRLTDQPLFDEGRDLPGRGMACGIAYHEVRCRGALMYGSTAWIGVPDSLNGFGASCLIRIFSVAAAGTERGG